MNSKELQTPFWLKAATPLDAKYGPYATIAERDAIPMEDRYQGMSVFVLDRGDGIADYYRLMQGITNNDWVSFSSTYKASIENHYGDMQAMYDDQANQSLQMIEYVADASADNIPGYAFYEYLGTSTGSRADYRLISAITGEKTVSPDDLAQPDTWYVNPLHGNDEDGNGSSQYPFRSVQKALDVANDFDVIYVVVARDDIGVASITISKTITIEAIGYALTIGTIYFDETSHKCHFKNINIFDIKDSPGSYFYFTLCRVKSVGKASHVTARGSGRIWNHSVKLNDEIQSLYAEYAIIEATNDITFTAPFYLNACKYSGNFHLESTDGYVYNSIIDGNVSTSNSIFIYENTVVTGKVTGNYEAHNQKAPSEVRQVLSINDSNATDAVALDGNSGIIQIQLDAAMTVDWKPSGITGWKQGRGYLFEIIKNADVGVDMSDARTAGNVGYNDDTDPFQALSQITTTQKRAVITAYGFKDTFGQFDKLVITDSNYIE